MSNLTTFQSRAAFQGVFINNDVRHFEVFFEGDKLANLITGVMIILSLLVVIGKIANSGQIAMMSDLAQAAIFGGKVLAIICRSLIWGVIGL